MNLELDAKIEAILFWKGEPISIAELSRLLHVSSSEVKQGLKVLEEKLYGRGVALIRTDNELALVTTAEASGLIEALRKEELSQDLSRAALETLAIILYRAPVSRRDIEYIRGVNTTSMLRTLLIRGLIERTAHKEDDRIFLYQPTIDLLAHLGIKNREGLPEFDAVKKELEMFAATEHAEEGQKNTHESVLKSES